MPSHAPNRWSRRQHARQNAEDSGQWRSAERKSRLPDWIPSPLRKLIRFSVKAGIVVSLIGLAIALFYFCLAFRYDLSAVAAMPERSVILDSQDRELAALHGENRRLITKEDIPPFFVAALLAREDKRFFEHHGVDVLGLLRATLRNAKDRSFTQGASTLSMQLARNSFNMRERSLHRKFLEIAITLRIEAHYNKNEILTCYLNRIYFGSGCHGLEEAALTYFGIPAVELSRTQCALLAGIIRAPHACSPLRNLKGALTQRNEVLDRMVSEETLTAEEAEKIRSAPVGLLKHPTQHSRSRVVPLVRRHFEELLEGTDRQDGGLVVRTTINAGYQNILEEELARFTRNLNPDIQIAAVILDAETGGIEAAIGSRNPATGRFHRALDARRDLGPLFTPFVLTAAAERSYPLDPSPVTTGTQLDQAEMIRLAKRFGFTGPFGQGSDLFRGTLSTTPLELATAAAVLSNGGNRPRSHLINSLRAPDDTLLFKNGSSATPAFSKGATNEALEMVFPANASPVLTNTSLANTDAWGLFLHPRHVVCVWAGHDRPQSLAQSRILTDLNTLLTRLSKRLSNPQ